MKKKIDLQLAPDWKVYSVPLRMLRGNRANPRDSSPTLLMYGYGVFERIEDSPHPSLMSMALSDNPAEQAAYADLLERYEPQLAQLGADVLDKGLLAPINVSPCDDETYDVIYGCRRVLSVAYNYVKTHAVNEPTIPARIKEWNESESAFVAFAENFHRLGHTPIDEAKHFLRMKNMNIPDQDIAQRCGVSGNYVKGRLKLNELPQDIQDKVAAGKLTVAKAIRMNDDPGELKKQQQNKLPSRAEYKRMYERENLHEEVRKFIARILGIKYEK
jgi:ParB/RepB/Spo0J family partition protein